MIFEFPVPACAVCKKPVESFTAYKSQHDMMYHFKASCHGEEEGFDLSELEVKHQIRLGQGTAFNRRIE